MRAGRPFTPGSRHSYNDVRMGDLIAVAGTVIFVAAMLGLVRLLERV